MSKRTRRNTSGLITNYIEPTSIPNVILVAKNDEQKEAIKTIHNSHITFIKGLPGTGKTHVATIYAVQQLLSGKCERIILTRPVIEAAGEKLGFLPGDIHDKIDPYMMPIFEILNQCLSPEVVAKLMNKHGKEGPIRTIPLAYMRGVSFKNSIVIGDEFQNATIEQMRMLLTRLGENSKMIVCGDTRQTDIHVKNGLEDAFDLLSNIDGISFISLSENAIVRHPLIQKIENKYEERQKLKKEEMEQKRIRRNNDGV